MADDEAEALGNWEDQADSGVLDKRLEEMAIDVTNQRDKKRQVVSVAQKMSEEGGPTPYQPQVRILKRDTSSTSQWPTQKGTNTVSPSASQGASKHSKSLQQREAEYAQARLRIFGSLPPPDDEEPTGDRSSNNSAGSKKGSEGSSIPMDCGPQIVKADPSLPRVAILRQPKSPDGTNGFKRPDHT